MFEETIITAEHQITTMEEGSNECGGQAVDDNLQQLRASLDSASELVMQLSYVYLQADFNDPVCHFQMTTMHNQLDDAVGKCLQMVEDINPMAEELNNCEISSIICSLHLLKTTWLFIYHTNGKVTDGMSGRSYEELQQRLFSGKLVSMFSINTIKTCIDRIDAYNKCFFGEIMNTANNKMDDCELQCKSINSDNANSNVKTNTETFSTVRENNSNDSEFSLLGNNGIAMSNEVHFETASMIYENQSQSVNLKDKLDDITAKDDHQDNYEQDWELMLENQNQVDIIKHEEEQDTSKERIYSKEQGKICTSFYAEMDKILEDFSIPEDDDEFDEKQTLQEINGINNGKVSIVSNDEDDMVLKTNMMSNVDDDDRHFQFNEVSKNDMKKSRIANQVVSRNMAVDGGHFTMKDGEQGKHNNDHDLIMNKESYGKQLIFETNGNSCNNASSINGIVDSDITDSMTFEANCIPATSDLVFHGMIKTEIFTDEATVFEASATGFAKNAEQVRVDLSNENLDYVYSSAQNILIEPLSAVLPIDWDHDSKTKLGIEENEKFVGIEAEDLFKVDISNTEKDDFTDLESFVKEANEVRNEAALENYEKIFTETANEDSNSFITPYSYAERAELGLNTDVVVVDSSNDYFIADTLPFKLENLNSINPKPTNESNVLKLDGDFDIKDVNIHLYASENADQKHQSFQIISSSISNEVPTIETATSTTSAANNLQSMILSYNVEGNDSIENMHQNDCSSLSSKIMNGQQRLSKKRKRKANCIDENAFKDCPSKRSNFLDEQESTKVLVSQFKPKTVEQYQIAIREVCRYLDGENEMFVEEFSNRKIRVGDCSRNKQIKLDSKQDAPFPVSLYISCGILPWYVKNKMKSPVNDDQCDVKVPSCIKERILQYRKWHPTVLDKLYCFDNHSPYLSDMKLFGCWECIRKHYNELFTWCKKVGLLKV